MKRWLKWTLSIIGAILLIIVIYIAWNWSTISIIAGTEALEGGSGAIPATDGRQTEPLQYGDADWQSWYGPRGERYSQVKGILTNWSTGLSKVWEVDFLCQGRNSAAWSAPVIQGNRLVVCGRDSESDLVFCLNPADGSLRWYKSYATKAQTNHGAGPRATPFIDDDRVYTFGRSGDLACWRLLDGENLWHKNVMDEGGEEPTWGHSSSPLISADLVLVQGGGKCRTIAYDKHTGSVVWKSGTGLGGYAALRTMDMAGRQTLLAFHGKGLAALTMDNGAELWNIDWETSYDVNATTPLVIDDRVFITSGYGTGCTLLKVNPSGAESLWRSELFSSIHSDPYVIDGYIYGYSGDSFQNKGAFKCIDLSSGEEKWSTNDLGWGTCLFVDGHLLCCDIKGNIFLIKPSPDALVKVTELPSVLGDIKGPVWTTPVVSNGHLYLRFKQKLVCYDIVG
jgi:outer membrane protein assembly factor BamB